MNNAIQSIVSSLDSYRRRGLTLTRARVELKLLFEKLGLTGNPYRLETIYRTTIQVAYNAGKMLAVERLEAEGEDIWYRYQTAKDERVRENHWAMQDITLPSDHPLWSVWYPPNGYNCRCWLQILRGDQQPKYPSVPVRPDEGFATNPLDIVV